MLFLLMFTITQKPFITPFCIDVQYQLKFIIKTNRKKKQTAELIEKCSKKKGSYIALSRIHTERCSLRSCHSFVVFLSLVLSSDMSGFPNLMRGKKTI